MREFNCPPLTIVDIHHGTDLLDPLTGSRHRPREARCQRMARSHSVRLPGSGQGISDLRGQEHHDVGHASIELHGIACSRKILCVRRLVDADSMGQR